MWHYWYFASMIIIYFFFALLQKIIRSKYLLPVFSSFSCNMLFLFYLKLRCFNLRKDMLYNPFRLWYWLLYFLLDANHK